MSAVAWRLRERKLRRLRRRSGGPLAEWRKIEAHPATPLPGRLREYGERLLEGYPLRDPPAAPRPGYHYLATEKSTGHSAVVFVNRGPHGGWQDAPLKPGGGLDLSTVKEMDHLVTVQLLLDTAMPDEFWYSLGGYRGPTAPKCVAWRTMTWEAVEKV